MKEDFNKSPITADYITYISGTRLPFTSASLLPVIFTASYIYVHEYINFDWINTILAVLGVLFLHLAANTINDYFDWDKSDAINENGSPFNGGSRAVIGHKNIDKIQFLYLASIFFLLALTAGICLIFMNRPLVLILGLFGASFGILYSAEPISLQSVGLGELLIFTAFGPVLTLGTGYAITGHISLPYLLIGIPSGLSTLAIIFVNEIPDYEADFQANKRNLIVRFGKNSGLYFTASVFILFFMSVILLIYKKILPINTLFVFLTIPPMFHVLFNIRKNSDDLKKYKSCQITTIMIQFFNSLILTVCLFFC